jgi:hypothetical protein
VIFWEPRSRIPSISSLSLRGLSHELLWHAKKGYVTNLTVMFNGSRLAILEGESITFEYLLSPPIPLYFSEGWNRGYG